MNRTFLLAGQPNVGKSTLFNALTGMHQHTGNWVGKTVETAKGVCRLGEEKYTILDLPGTYSLDARSPEEDCARAQIVSGKADAVILVCDACAPARSLAFALQVLSLTTCAVLAFHFTDAAEKHGIRLDYEKLETLLGVPVVQVDARRKKGLDTLLYRADAIAQRKDAAGGGSARRKIVEMLSDASPLSRAYAAKEIESQIRTDVPVKRKERSADRYVLHPRWGGALLLALLCAVLLLTIYGANVPSAWLSKWLFSLQMPLERALAALRLPPFAVRALVQGAYRTLAWVLSVMLPPMAIFFSLFSLLEDCGYLPRAAFLLDRPFAYCGGCGKQAMTMCMGLGCNAAGVMGCRIMDSERERRIAIATNALMPCNGRFPMLITVLMIFFANGIFGKAGAALLLCGCLLLSFGATLLVSRLLGKTILRGFPSSFALELPPYRRPSLLRALVHAFRERTLRVAARAALVAAPAGLVLFLLANCTVGDRTILSYCIAFLDPAARWIGMDGVLLAAFILAFPANEIVLPIAILGYTATGTLTDGTAISAMRSIFLQNGWTTQTAVCFLLFALFHWPCSTTVLTIKKETGSIGWTILSVLLPTFVGTLLCVGVHVLFTMRT